MNKILIVFSIFLFTGCGEEKTKSKTSLTIQKSSRFNKLLSKFTDISFDTLNVNSPVESENVFTGHELDSADVILFPEEISEHHFRDPPGVFAIYKFPIDSNLIGLIARTPSEYAPTSIKLFYFDKRKDSITSYIELAEIFGDAGDAMSKVSWLIREPTEKLNCLIWVLESHDNSLENEKDTTIQEWNNYYLLDISKNYPDTISQDSKMLVKKFERLIRSSHD